MIALSGNVYTRNETDPSTDPCGIPHCRGVSLDETYTHTHTHTQSVREKKLTAVIMEDLNLLTIIKLLSY